MSAAPKPKLYAIAASFGSPDGQSGSLALGTWFAPDVTLAAATIATLHVQRTGEARPLQSYAWLELTEEMLSAWLGMLRTGGKPAEVARLYPAGDVRGMSSEQLRQMDQPSPPEPAA